MEGKRKEKFEAQTKEQFEALGRFVQGFEQMVFAARTSVEQHFTVHRQMVYYTRMVFHHRALTAWPIWELFRGLIYTDLTELAPVDNEKLDSFDAILNKIAARYQSLVELRNNILHGTPFIGWASSDQDDFTHLDILKWGVSKKGWKQYALPESASELLELVSECKRVEDAIRYVSIANRMREKSDLYLGKAEAVLASS